MSNDYKTIDGDELNKKLAQHVGWTDLKVTDEELELVGTMPGEKSDSFYANRLIPDYANDATEATLILRLLESPIDYVRLNIRDGSCQISHGYPKAIYAEVTGDPHRPALAIARAALMMFDEEEKNVRIDAEQNAVAKENKECQSS
tara:strand:- start:2864 stop:3301 length:438 start_codon:yes stop_codon:yes gene_type:complete